MTSLKTGHEFDGRVRTGEERLNFFSRTSTSSVDGSHVFIK